MNKTNIENSWPFNQSSVINYGIKMLHWIKVAYFKKGYLTNKLVIFLRHKLSHYILDLRFIFNIAYFGNSINNNENTLCFLVIIYLLIDIVYSSLCFSCNFFFLVCYDTLILSLTRFLFLAMNDFDSFHDSTRPVLDFRNDNPK